MASSALSASTGALFFFLRDSTDWSMETVEGTIDRAVLVRVDTMSKSSCDSLTIKIRKLPALISR